MMARKPRRLFLLSLVVVVFLLVRIHQLPPNSMTAVSAFWISLINGYKGSIAQGKAADASMQELDNGNDLPPALGQPEVGKKGRNAAIGEICGALATSASRETFAKLSHSQHAQRKKLRPARHHNGAAMNSPSFQTH